MVLDINSLGKYIDVVVWNNKDIVVLVIFLIFV